MHSKPSPENGPIPTASDVEKIVADFHERAMAPLNAWLASLEGKRFASKEEARLELRRIVHVVRSAGCELLWNGKPVYLVAGAGTRQKSPSIQLRNREPGQNVYLHSAVAMPPLSARPLKA